MRNISGKHLEQKLLRLFPYLGLLGELVYFMDHMCRVYLYDLWISDRFVNRLYIYDERNFKLSMKFFHILYV